MDWYDESNVYGRLVRSEKDGVFSYGGLTGRNLKPSLDKNNTEFLEQCRNQYILYITEEVNIPDNFTAYRSQPGGQAIMYGVLQKILPVQASDKIKIFIAINAMLVAICFVLFLGWIIRNFNLTTAIVTFIFIFLSNWVNNFAHSLWWAFWSFYIPFLSVLLYLEKCNSKQSRYSNIKLFSVILAATLAKCFFTGFEFITTTLFSAFCPILYYHLLNKEQSKELIKKIVLTGSSMLTAIITSMLILITQLKFLLGSYQDGVNHIIHSFIKRTSYNQIPSSYIADSNPNMIDTLANYLRGRAFNVELLQKLGFNHNFKFVYFILLLFISSILIYIFSKKSNSKDINKYKPLLITTYFSIMSPLSWFIIFKQHAYIHYFLDYIVWYIPFLLFVFMIIGVTFSLLFSEFFNRNRLTIKKR